MKTLANYIKESSNRPEPSPALVFEASEMLPEPKSKEEMVKACKKNALYKAMEKKCASYGYTLVDARFDYYGPNTCVPYFRVVPPASEKYVPDIVLDVDMKLNYKFMITGSSSSRMDLKDAERWAFFAQKGVDLLKWLCKQDLTKLPVFSYVKE